MYKFVPPLSTLADPSSSRTPSRMYTRTHMPAPRREGGAPHSAHHSHDCPQHVIREQHRLDAGSRGPPSLPAPSPLPLLHPTPSHPLPHSVAQGIYLIIKYTLHTLLMTFATLLACVSTGKYQMEGREERGDNETKRMREEEGKGGRQTGWG